MSSLCCQRDARFGAGPVGSETRPALLPEPAVPQVAHRAAGPGDREGTEDPVHLPEGDRVICSLQLHCLRAYFVPVTVTYLLAEKLK